MNMRNKIFGLIIFIVTIPFGCSCQKNMLDEQKMIGKWHLCKIYSGKIATNFNVCPDISFKEESRGFLQTNSISEFEWKMSANIVSIKFDKQLNEKDIMLGLSGCTVKYIYDENSEYLELEDVKSGRKYILSRSK